MSEETQAASSTAVVEAPIEIPRSGTSEYAQWRIDGSLPEKKVQPKIEESAPSDISKETKTEDSADSAATQKQEKQSKRRPDIEERFKQYTDRIDRLERELDEARRPKETKADSSPAKQPQTYNDWRKEFKPSKWIEQYGKEHPDDSYEDATAAMADYLGDVRDQFRSIEQQQNAQKQALQAKLDDARKVYPNADKAIFPTGEAIRSDPAIPLVVKEIVADSEVFPHLLYVLGNDSEKFKEFKSLAQTQPGKAIRFIAALETGIIEELAKPQDKESGRDNKGQFIAKEPPAKRGPESAPEPPIEIGSRGSGAMNESERAFQAIERGNAKATREWLRAENAKDMRRRRGA